MGIETILILGATLLQADANIKQAESEAQAIADQGSLDAKNAAQKTVLRAARQQSSFLNSGLLLEGTPMSAIQNTFAVGLEDVNQITTNANRRSSNIIKGARANTIASFAKMGAGMVGSGDLFSSTSSTTGVSDGIFSQTTTTTPSVFGGAGETVTHF